MTTLLALEQVERLVQQKRWSEAEKLCSELLPAASAEPERERALLLRSGCRMMLGDLDGAIEDALERATLRPDDGARHVFLGGLLYYNKQFEAAAEAFSMGLERGADDAANRGSRGEARQQLGDLRGALDDFARAIELDPSFAPAWKCRGTAHAIVGDFEDAIRDWRRAIALDPDQRDLLDKFIGEAEGRARQLDVVIPEQEHRVVRVACFGSTDARRFGEPTVTQRLWGRRAMDVAIVPLGILRRHAVLAEVAATDDPAILPDLVAGAHGFLFVAHPGAIEHDVQAHGELVAAMDAHPHGRVPLVYLSETTNDEDHDLALLRTAFGATSEQVFVDANAAFRALVKAVLVGASPSAWTRAGRSRYG